MLFKIFHSLNFITVSYLGYFWNVGFVLFFFLLIMIFSGIFLSINYTPTLVDAFDSVNFFFSEVEYGWLVSHVHCVGSSFFWLLLYIHIFKSFFFALSCNSLVWISGFFIYFFCMVISFLGYCLPMGSMSYWAIVVVMNFFSVFPCFDLIKGFIMGGDSICDITIKSFFVLHFLLPFFVVIISFLHVLFLHLSGSSSGGFEHFKVNSFYPYMFFKDLFFLFIVLFFFVYCVCFFPLDFYNFVNFNKFDPYVTPEHITPEWYLIPFFLMLKSFSSKAFGMFFVILCFFLLFVSFITCNFSYSYFYSFSSFFFGFLFVLVFVVFIFYLDFNSDSSFLMYYYSYLFLFCVGNINSLFEFGLNFLFIYLFFKLFFLCSFLFCFYVFIFSFYVFYLRDFSFSFSFNLSNFVSVVVDSLKREWCLALSKFSFLGFVVKLIYLFYFVFFYFYFLYFLFVVILISIFDKLFFYYFMESFLGYYFYYFLIYLFKFLVVEVFRVCCLFVFFSYFYCVVFYYFFFFLFGLVWCIFFFLECVLIGSSFMYLFICFPFFYLFGLCLSYFFVFYVLELVLYIFSCCITFFEELTLGGGFIDAVFVTYMEIYFSITFKMMLPFVDWSTDLGLNGIGNFISDWLESQFDYFMKVWMWKLPGSFIKFFKDSSFSTVYDSIFFEHFSSVFNYIHESSSIEFWEGYKNYKELWSKTISPFMYLLEKLSDYLDKKICGFVRKTLMDVIMDIVWSFFNCCIVEFFIVFDYILNLFFSSFSYFLSLVGMIFFFSVCGVTSHLFNFSYLFSEAMCSLMFSFGVMHYFHIVFFIFCSFFLSYKCHIGGKSFVSLDIVLWLFTEIVWFFFLLLFLVSSSLLSLFLV